MTVTVIDTLQFAKIMQNFSLNHKIPEESVKAINDFISIFTKNIPIKQDLQSIQKNAEIINNDIKSDEINLRKEINTAQHMLNAKIQKINAKIEAVTDKLVIKIGAMITIAFAIIACLNGKID